LVFDAVPKFPGGDKNYKAFIRKSIHYPASARKKHLEGRVFVTVVLEKDGHVTNAKVLHGISTDLDNEALRVIKLLPKWKPAIYKNKPVRVQYLLPIKFELSSNN
jgi:TonB family protein